MRSSGFIRSIMAKNSTEEDFFHYVIVDIVDRVLQEWEYDTMVLYDRNSQQDPIQVTIMIDLALHIFRIQKSEIRELKQQDPYALDRHIWLYLKDIGIQLRDDPYMKSVFKTSKMD